jgi:DNA-binding HxlR family transcriptional regulator
MSYEELSAPDTGGGTQATTTPSNLDLFGDLLGRKWTLKIVRTLLDEGPLGFSDLAREVGGVSNKVLTESLTDLQAKGLVDRRVVDDRPFRVRYSVTDEGGTLAPILDAIDAWGAGPQEAVTCASCSTELAVARECSYCSERYCADHRLPERHDCPGVAALDEVGRRFESGFDAVAREAVGVRQGSSAEEGRRPGED